MATTKTVRCPAKDIDVILFDIQDVGAPLYYISTMYYVMEACAEQEND